MRRSPLKATSFITAALFAAPTIAMAAQQPLGFEGLAEMSDLIVDATVIGSSADTATLPDGTAIDLGLKVSDRVFTPYRVRIGECLFDAEGECRAGEIEVLIPGGTLFETIDGETKLRTWEITGAASAPLTPSGARIVLFLRKFQGRYAPVGDAGARLPVSRLSGHDRVHLRFASPRLLSPEALAAASRAAPAAPSSSQPEFAEDVALDRLKALVIAARAMRRGPKR